MHAVGAGVRVDVECGGCGEVMDRQHHNANGAEKLRFPTPEAARAAVEDYERYWHQRMGVYRCSVCQAWHVGHKWRRGQRK